MFDYSGTNLLLDLICKTGALVYNLFKILLNRESSQISSVVSNKQPFFFL